MPEKLLSAGQGREKAFPTVPKNPTGTKKNPARFGRGESTTATTKMPMPTKQFAAAFHGHYHTFALFFHHDHASKRI